MKSRPAITHLPFSEAVPDLLRERDWSQRRLAQKVGVDPAYISRAISGRGVSPELAERVAAVFGLPGDFFPEVREGLVIDAVRSDPKLCERVYRNLVVPAALERAS